jgi:predicted porin
VLVDIATHAYGSNQWVPYNFSFQPEASMSGGIWSSNMTKYVAQYGDFLGEASYALGGVPGHTAYGSQMQIGAAYVPNSALRLGAAYVDTRDSDNGSQFKAWTVGGSYTWRNTQLHVGYYENRQDPGFANYANGPFTAAVLTALKYANFSSRRMIAAGISQVLSPALRVGVNYWRTVQSGKTPQNDGNASQFEIIADYSLSKRTDVYIESNYSLYRGGLIGAQLQGINAASVAYKGTQLGVMAGMRHAF